MSGLDPGALPAAGGAFEPTELVAPLPEGAPLAGGAADLLRQRLARGGTLQAVSFAVSVLTGGAWLVVAVRSLPRATYGGLAVAIAAASLLAAIGNLGLNPAVAQAAAAEGARRGAAGRNAVLRSALTIALVATALVALASVALVGGHFASSGFLPEWVPFVLLLPLCILAPAGALSTGFLRASFRSTLLTVTSVAASLLSLAAVVAAVLLHHRSADVVALTRSVPGAAAIAYLIRAVWRTARAAPAAGYEKDLARRILGFTMAMALTTLFAMALSQLDVLVLGLVKGTHVVALYQPASLVADVLFGMPSVLGTYFLPAAALSAAAAREGTVGRGGEVAHLYHWASRWNLVLCAPAIAVTLVFPGSLLHLLFGHAFLAVVGPLRVLALGALVQVLFGYNGLTLDAQGLARLVAVRQAITLAVSVGGCLVLIPLLGPLGAAAATTIALFVSNVLCSAALAKRNAIWPWDLAEIVTVAASLAAAAGAWALGTVVTGDIARIVVTGALTLVATAAASLLSGGRHGSRRRLGYSPGRASADC